MSARVFIQRHGGGDEHGPYAEEEVLDALAAGDLSLDDRCRLENQALLQRVGDVFECVTRDRAGDEDEDEEEEHEEEQETLIYRGTPSLLGYGWAFVVAAGVLVLGYWLGQFGVLWVGGGLAISLLLIVRLLLHRGSREYVVTSGRVESTYGLVAKSTRSIALSELGSIRLHRPRVLRWFGVGTIIFARAAGGDGDVVFERIGRVGQVIALVREHQRIAVGLGID